jgi:hypothetical protein
MMSKSAFFTDVHENNTTLSDFYSKTEQSTIKYLFDILKSLPTKPLGKLLIKKYIEELRLSGPKVHVLSLNGYIPIIRSMGQISCANEYLSTVLLPTISNFIDISIVYDTLLLCSHCDVENIFITEQHQLLPLLTTNCEGLLLPDVALKNYFLLDDNNNNTDAKTCYSCGKTSVQHKCYREIVQLPDTLLVSFMPESYVQNSNNQVKTTEFLIQNKLNMSRFVSNQLICYPSYFEYELKSVIISTGDKESDRHYYTFAKYDEQFYLCNDKLIEIVNKSVVFERNYSFSTAMYIRNDLNHVNFTETISQIVFEKENLNSTGYIVNAHIKMMFGAALEHVARNTKLLCWGYGAVYTCLGCKERESSLLLFQNFE